jgi:hypothetical protein
MADEELHTDAEALVSSSVTDDEIGAAPAVAAAIGGVVALVIAAGFVAVLIVAFGVVIGFLVGMAIMAVRKVVAERRRATGTNRVAASRS